MVRNCYENDTILLLPGMATWDGVPSLLATHPSKTLGDTAIEDVFQPGDTAIEDGSRTLATQPSKMVLGVGNLGDTPSDTYMGGCCRGMIVVALVSPYDFGGDGAANGGVCVLSGKNMP